MSKKKCKCKDGKKCQKCFKLGAYYFAGHATKKQLKMMCEMIEEGIHVYHLSGKPNGCGTPGHPCG